MFYENALDLHAQVVEIVEKLGLSYIDTERVACIRSRGSHSRRVVARVHNLPKAVQTGMNCGAFYTIEFLERFERLSDEQKTETIIHELLHIPQTFGGGFRHHNFVCAKKVKEMYRRFVENSL